MHLAIILLQRKAFNKSLNAAKLEADPSKAQAEMLDIYHILQQNKEDC
jgi:hypothetical protein